MTESMCSCSLLPAELLSSCRSILEQKSACKSFWGDCHVHWLQQQSLVSHGLLCHPRHVCRCQPLLPPVKFAHNDPACHHVALILPVVCEHLQILRPSSLCPRQRGLTLQKSDRDVVSRCSEHVCDSQKLHTQSSCLRLPTQSLSLCC